MNVVSTYTKNLAGLDLAGLSKNEILATVEHALAVARECPHRANGGANVECLSIVDDLGDDSKPNARGKRRLALWNGIFFSVVSHESFNGHNPR